jgi:hypothetical protein
MEVFTRTITIQGDGKVDYENSIEYLREEYERLYNCGRYECAEI